MLMVGGYGWGRWRQVWNEFMKELMGDWRADLFSSISVKTNALAVDDPMTPVSRNCNSAIYLKSPTVLHVMLFLECRIRSSQRDKPFAL